MQKPRHGRGFPGLGRHACRPELLWDDVGCARAFLTLLDIVGDALPFGQRLEATPLDGAVMDENVLRAIGRCDEAEAFFVTEPLNCTCSHFGNL